MRFAALLFVFICACTPATELEPEAWRVRYADAGEWLDASVEYSYSVKGRPPCSANGMVIGPLADGAQSALALLPNGDALVVWADSSATPRVYARRFSPDGGASTPEVLWSMNSERFSLLDLSLATNANGDGIATWHTLEATSRLFARPFTVARGWGRSQQIGDERTIFTAKNGITANGDAVVVTVERRDETARAVVSRTRDRLSGQWSEPVSLAPDERVVTRLRLQVTDEGEALAAWTGYGGLDFKLKVSASRRHTDGGWTTRALGPGEETWSEPAIMLRNQAASVFWVNDHKLMAASEQNGSWSLQTDLFPRDGGIHSGGVAAVKNANATAIVWQTESKDVEVSQNRGAGWETPELIDARFGDSALLVSASGANGMSVVGRWRSWNFATTTFWFDGTRLGTYLVEGFDDETSTPQVVIDGNASQWILADERRPRRPVIVYCR